MSGYCLPICACSSCCRYILSTHHDLSAEVVKVLVEVLLVLHSHIGLHYDLEIRSYMFEARKEKSVA